MSCLNLFPSNLFGDKKHKISHSYKIPTESSSNPTPSSTYQIFSCSVSHFTEMTSWICMAGIWIHCHQVSVVNLPSNMFTYFLCLQLLLSFKSGLWRYCRSVTTYPILKSKTLRNKATLLSQMTANSSWPKHFQKQKLTWIDLTIFILLSVNIHVLLQNSSTLYCRLLSQSLLNMLKLTFCILNTGMYTQCLETSDL